MANKTSCVIGLVCSMLVCISEVARCHVRLLVECVTVCIYKQTISACRPT